MASRFKSLWIVQIFAFIVYATAMPGLAHAESGVSHDPLKQAHSHQMHGHQEGGHSEHGTDISQSLAPHSIGTHQHLDGADDHDGPCCSVIGGTCVVLLMTLPGVPDINRNQAMGGRPLPSWSEAPLTSLPHPPKPFIS